MRCFGALIFCERGGVGGLLVGLLAGLTPWVDVVKAAVCGTANEGGAVELRDKSKDVEGWKGVDGVVWCGHFPEKEGEP